MKRSEPDENRRGNILAALLFALLCIALCLTLLTHSIGHHRIMGIRQARDRALAALKDGLNLEIHRYFSILNQADLDTLEDPETTLFSRETFPEQFRPDCRLTHDFQLQSFIAGDLEILHAMDHIRARQIKGPYEMEADVDAMLLSGSIPVHSIPLFLTARIPEGIPVRDWLETRGIRVSPAMVPRVTPQNPGLDVRSLTRRVLDLGDLELSWAEIRRRLGLPVSNMPPPDGIYLIRDPENIHAVLVQGNLDGLTFSGHSNFQRLDFTIRGDTFRMEYEPKGTMVDCWIPDSLSATSFSECIVVNGDCRNIRTATDGVRELPAFHPDSRILLLVSGETVIHSALEKEMRGTRRIQPPGVSIVCAKSEVLQQGGDGIRVECESPVNLNATLITNGRITNGEGNLRVTGGICAGELENRGEITLIPSPDHHPLLGDLVLRNLKALTVIRLLRIEEVYPDEES